MDIHLSQSVTTGDGQTGRQLIKSFAAQPIPSVGFKIKDIAFRGPSEYEVVNVVINYENEECWVHLEPVYLESNDPEDLKDFIREYLMRGWECPVSRR
ncbi:hypothetical protein [Paenibacillus vini]|uniref:Uncharacterized protein n=1 Tax=Paenibacillus vini TaxID=1476024 RepID=A0ABQ4MFG6_9BACL|nr:hypothetical protein [Paenibacillus vini]GIP54737.1 hypothetical protein J42TS3_37720 [Paenibacillus vini]